MARRVLKKKMVSIPPELDPNSEFFDPEKVMAADCIVLHYPNAWTYNNLAEYYSRVFLKKADLKKSVKEIPQERNFAWYYSTIGYDPSYGHEHYSNLNKQFNNRKRRKRVKKRAAVCIFPCEPMRSQKVVIKSEYKTYCRRKFPKWFKEFSSSYEASLDQDTTPCMSLDEFVVRIMETTNVGNNSMLLQQKNVVKQNLTNSHRNVLIKFDKNTDPLGFLKCILFGKVEIDQPLALGANSNDKPCFELPLPLFAQSPSFIPDPGVFLCIDTVVVNKNDNSAYETESSGYMSDGSEVYPSTQCLETLHTSRHCSLKSVQTTIKSKNAGTLSKQTETFVHESVLKSKEKCLALGTLEEDDPPSVIENAENSKKRSIVVSINRKLITLGNLEVITPEKLQLKENQLPAGCRCNSKISKELSSQCTCGFYSKAVNKIRKFKIPLKQAVKSSTADIKVNKKIVKK